MGSNRRQVRCDAVGGEEGGGRGGREGGWRVILIRAGPGVSPVQTNIMNERRSGACQRGNCWHKLTSHLWPVLTRQEVATIWRRLRGKCLKVLGGSPDQVLTN